MKEIGEQRRILYLYQTHHRRAIAAQNGAFIPMLADIFTDHLNHKTGNGSFFRHFVKTQPLHRLLGIGIADVFGKLPKKTGRDNRQIVFELSDTFKRIAGGDDGVKFANTHAITAIHTTVGIYIRLAVSHANRFGGTHSYTGGASSTVIFQDLDGVKVFAIGSIHRRLIEKNDELQSGGTTLL